MKNQKKRIMTKVTLTLLLSLVIALSTLTISVFGMTSSSTFNMEEQSNAYSINPRMVWYVQFTLRAAGGVFTPYMPGHDETVREIFGITTGGYTIRDFIQINCDIASMLTEPIKPYHTFIGWFVPILGGIYTHEEFKDLCISLFSHDSPQLFSPSVFAMWES